MKGNRILNVRFDEEMIASLMTDLKRRNDNSAGALWTLSDFVRQAVREKLRKGARSRCRVSKV